MFFSATYKTYHLQQCNGNVDSLCFILIVSKLVSWLKRNVLLLNLKPKFLKGSLILYVPAWKLRSQGGHPLDPSIDQRNSLNIWKTGFLVAAPQLQNIISKEVHLNPLLLIFRRHLKIVLFIMAFDLFFAYQQFYSILLLLNFSATLSSYEVEGWLINILNN